MKIPTNQLLELPVGAVFHDDDDIGRLFEKTDNTQNHRDIIVKAFGRDAEEHSMGIEDMSDCDKRSREWCVMTDDELDAMIGRLMLSQIQVYS